MAGSAGAGAGGASGAAGAGGTGAAAGAAGTGGGAAGGAGTAGSAGGGPAPVDTFTKEAAGAICGALFRCCTSTNLSDYFQGFLGAFPDDKELQAFAAKLPPSASLDEASCPAVLSDMLMLRPFEDWVKLAKTGEVSYDPAKTKACGDTLKTAACGKDVNLALYDGTCFSFTAPAGGADQRKMFSRTRAVGQSCTPIRDGFGGILFGSCDPTKSFCCNATAAAPNKCGLPGAGKTSTCVAAPAVGATCSADTTNLAVCQTGVSCDPDTNKCVASKTDPLAVGAKCVDASYNELGVCVDSWCDVLGNKLCTAKKPNGASCQGGDECATNVCDKGKCADLSFCVAP